jgi:hypothetical protein
LVVAKEAIKKNTVPISCENGTAWCGKPVYLLPTKTLAGCRRMLYREDMHSP